MPEVMWYPPETLLEQSQMAQFLSFINNRHLIQLKNYPDLYEWSIQNLTDFWKAVWDFCTIKASQQPDIILQLGNTMRDAKWFLGAKMNFAENLLSRRDNKLAIIFRNENNQRRTYTYAQLYQEVAKVATHLQRVGITINDRVAGVLPNIPETIICMLATASLGAVWSSCSPDFGCEALYDRFNQIRPKLLITCDGYWYNGKVFSNESKITYLQQKIPSIMETICIDYVGCQQSIASTHYSTILNNDSENFEFKQLPFDQPLYIMYSSGTTGVPKCIVHGAGGTLLQHLKELRLHTNVKANDTIFYYTTCGWMMWNWYISSLALGATVIQYDGAAFYPNAARLIDLIEEEQISVFGTSAKYLSALEENDVKPIETHDLSSLLTILSTGSPLVPKNYDYVYQRLKKDLCLSSISGGTDIISCFALGNPLLPVYRGELQSVGLGMDVKIYNDAGQEVMNEKGELICKSPFPSMPIYFWNDPDDKLYQKAYFSKFPDVWAHGDFAEITERGTVVIYGRSDAILNPGGVRIGTAEIYRQVEKMSEVIESLAAGQEWDNDVRIILFVVLKPPAKLDQDLQNKIKHIIKLNCSPRHVPAIILAVPDIPRTLSGKIVELAVKDIIHHRPVNNLSSIANPECLVHFKKLTEKHLS